MSGYLTEESSMLYKAMKDVVAAHKNRADVTYSEEELEKFIRAIEAKKKSAIPEFEKLLSEKQILALVGYVAGNLFHVDETNHLQIIGDCATYEQNFQLLRNWENQYDNDDVKGYLEKKFSDREVFGQALQIHGIQYEKFQGLVALSLSPIGVVNSARVDSFTAFKYDLLQYGVLDDTTLMQKCLSEFLFVCSEAAYLELGQEKLTKQYVNFTSADRARFIDKFVKKMPILKLGNFFELYRLVHNDWQKYAEFKQYLIQHGDEQKLRQWGNLYVLRSSFDDSERYTFWAPYVLNSEYGLEKGYKFVALKFGAYVVVEMMNDIGPCYIIDATDFKEKYYGAFKHNRIGYEPSVNSYFFHKYNDRNNNPGIRERLTHQGYWQSDFSWALKRYGIQPVKNA